MDAALVPLTPAVRELEDENSALRTKLELLQSEKRDLAATCDRQEQTIQALRSKLHREAEAMSVAQQQMQRDLLELVSQIEAQEAEKLQSHQPHDPQEDYTTSQMIDRDDESGISVSPPSRLTSDSLVGGSVNTASAPSSRRPTVEPARPSTAPQGSLLLLPEHEGKIPAASSSTSDDPTKSRSPTNKRNSGARHRLG